MMHSGVISGILQGLFLTVPIVSGARTRRAKASSGKKRDPPICPQLTRCAVTSMEIAIAVTWIAIVMAFDCMVSDSAAETTRCHMHCTSASYWTPWACKWQEQVSRPCSERKENQRERERERERERDRESGRERERERDRERERERYIYIYIEREREREREREEEEEGGREGERERGRGGEGERKTL